MAKTEQQVIDNTELDSAELIFMWKWLTAVCCSIHQQNTKYLMSKREEQINNNIQQIISNQARHIC